MIVDAVRVACGSDGVMVEDEDPLRPPPFSPPLDSGHNPSEANPAAGEARLHAELQSTLIEQQDQQQRCAEKGVVSEVKVRFGGSGGMKLYAVNVCIICCFFVVYAWAYITGCLLLHAFGCE